MMKKIIGLACGAALIVGLSACGSKKDDNTAASPGSSVAPVFANAEVETLYKGNCMSCHGDTLGGKMGPNLTKVGAKLASDKIATKIQNGGGGMPAFKSKLKDTEITALADWLATKK